jgi:hypothetical protein
VLKNNLLQEGLLFLLAPSLVAVQVRIVLLPPDDAAGEEEERKNTYHKSNI